MTATAAYVITQALRLFGIIDQTEQPTSTDFANNVPILNDLVRAEQADGACQYTIQRVYATLPKGVFGVPYTFSIGVAQLGYLVQQDAVAVREIWMNDVNLTVNRTTRQSPTTDVVRTLNLGIITKWHQERQADNSILVTAWQAPRAPAKALIEFGGRIPILSNPAGTDVIAIPSEGIHELALLLGRRVMGSYGRVIAPTDPIMVDAAAAKMKWDNYARGQQWLRFIRA